MWRGSNPVQEPNLARRPAVHRPSSVHAVAARSLYSDTRAPCTAPPGGLGRCTATGPPPPHVRPRRRAPQGPACQGPRPRRTAPPGPVMPGRPRLPGAQDARGPWGPGPAGPQAQAAGACHARTGRLDPQGPHKGGGGWTGGGLDPQGPRAPRPPGRGRLDPQGGGGPRRRGRGRMEGRGPGACHAMAGPGPAGRRGAAWGPGHDGIRAGPLQRYNGGPLRVATCTTAGIGHRSQNRRIWHMRPLLAL
jgi:hypothetical protein